jgi:dTDP-4-dehydrorhamnose reductase
VRVVVIGHSGQVAQALHERGAALGEQVICLGRPIVDLARQDDLRPVLAAREPDVVINAAAYTAVDRAEAEPELARAVNGTGAGRLAAASSSMGVPFVHLSTDYVFDGLAARPYVETDEVSPINAYGRSKLAGEREVHAQTSDHAILRMAWVYSPFGTNFVKTMLRLAESRDEVPVVADQVGSPTSALDAADAIIRVARNMVARPAEPDLRGTFHLAGEGDATWADVAEEIFAESALRGGPNARVRRITTTEYPTPAARPANSRLNCSRLAQIHGVTLPPWRASVRGCVRRLRTTAAMVDG